MLNNINNQGMQEHVGLKKQRIADYVTNTGIGRSMAEIILTSHAEGISQDEMTNGLTASIKAINKRISEISGNNEFLLELGYLEGVYESLKIVRSLVPEIYQKMNIGEVLFSQLINKYGEFIEMKLNESNSQIIESNKQDMFADPNNQTRNVNQRIAHVRSINVE